MGGNAITPGGSNQEVNAAKWRDLSVEEKQLEKGVKISLVAAGSLVLIATIVGIVLLATSTRGVWRAAAHSHQPFIHGPGCMHGVLELYAPRALVQSVHKIVSNAAFIPLILVPGVILGPLSIGSAFAVDFEKMDHGTVRRDLEDSGENLNAAVKLSKGTLQEVIEYTRLGGGLGPLVRASHPILLPDEAQELRDLMDTYTRLKQDKESMDRYPDVKDHRELRRYDEVVNGMEKAEAKWKAMRSKIEARTYLPKKADNL